jgi:hypothetical protein
VHRVVLLVQPLGGAGRGLACGGGPRAALRGDLGPAGCGGLRLLLDLLGGRLGLCCALLTSSRDLRPSLRHGLGGPLRDRLLLAGSGRRGRPLRRCLRPAVRGGPTRGGPRG